MHCKVSWLAIGIVHMTRAFQKQWCPQMFAFSIGSDAFFFPWMFGGSSIYRLYLSFWKYQYAWLVPCGFLPYQEETLRRTPNPSSPPPLICVAWKLPFHGRLAGWKSRKCLEAQKIAQKASGHPRPPVANGTEECLIQVAVNTNHCL